MDIVWLIVAGLVVGALGRAAQPGSDLLGLGLTLVVGAGSVLGIGLLVEDWGFWGDALAVGAAGALVVLAARLVDRRRRVA